MDFYGSLKPCPFCGGEAELDIMPDMAGWIRVRCTNCHASTKVFAGGNGRLVRVEAIARWNLRAEALDLSSELCYWGAVVDNARKIAMRGDMNEIEEVRSFLTKALQAIKDSCRR